MQNSFKSKIKYFFREVLRPRTKRDYAEFFRRGGEKGGSCGVPWVWLRALALGFLLFAVAMLAYRLSRGSVEYMTVIVCGGLCINVPVLVFYFELYPKRNLSIFLLLLILLVGGVLSVAVITLGYEYIYSDVFRENAWISTLWTGFWEELVKAVFAISAIAILRKKDPFCCFLIGFAVGTGYSIFEDLGYVYSYSGGQRFYWVVLMSLGRGLSCAFSHAPWTGAIGWAFAKFKKPFLNYRFYLIVLASMVLHYFADIPFFVSEVAFLRGLNFGWLIEAAVVIGVVLLQFYILRDARKGLSLPIYAGQCGEAFVLGRAERLSFAANLTAVLCAVAVGACSLCGCALNESGAATVEKFYDAESFVNYVQNGLPLKARTDREYDVELENYSAVYSGGELKNAVQLEEEDGHEYYYFYSFDGDGATLKNVGVRVEGQMYYLSRYFIYDSYSIYLRGGAPSYEAVEDFIPPTVEEPDEPEEPIEPEEPDEPQEPIEPEEPDDTEDGDTDFVPPQLLESFSFFDLNGGLALSYDVEEKCFKVYTGYEYTDLTAAYIALGALAGAATFGGAAAVITFKIKARRLKDD